MDSDSEQVKRWAEYVREHPGEWKRHLKPFLDAQILMARRFYRKLAKTPEGREKINLIRDKKRPESNNLKSRTQQ